MQQRLYWLDYDPVAFLLEWASLNCSHCLFDGPKGNVWSTRTLRQ
jgi:hypothetical protein